jgi:hypothetical protein
VSVPHGVVDALSAMIVSLLLMVAFVLALLAAMADQFRGPRP